MFLVDNAENDIKRVRPHHTCQHGVPEPQCPEARSKEKALGGAEDDNRTVVANCPSPEDIKYKMTRVTLDSIDIYLAEQDAALNLQVIFYFHNNMFIFITYKISCTCNQNVPYERSTGSVRLLKMVSCDVD